MENLAERNRERNKPSAQDTRTEGHEEVDSGSVGGGSSTASGGNDKRSVFADKVRQSTEALQSGNYSRAIHLFTETIALNPDNHILYSNRSAAYVKEKQYEKALQDAVKAKQLNPKWSKAYYRQGVALEHLGRHAEALAAFSSGLSQDPKSLQLLSGLVEAALKSPITDTFGPVHQQLKDMKLDKSPFMVIAVIGQELLAAGYHSSSLTVLESALKIGTCSLKLKGSVYSALSSAHWGLNNTDKAIAYMQQDLGVAKSLGDYEGECRAHGNLGAAFYSKGDFKEALAHHRFQLVLAMKKMDKTTASSALSSLGHVYTSIGDYPNALASHRQCQQLAAQLNNLQLKGRETGNMGAVCLAMGDFENALEAHHAHLAIAQQLENRGEAARAYSNLGSAYHYRREFAKAKQYHGKVLELAKGLQDRTVEARACAGLGHACRCLGQLEEAKHFHEQQLTIGVDTKDKAMEGRACSNLGIIYQLQQQYQTALKLHQTHLEIAGELGDAAGQGRAYGNMGNAYSALGQYQEAVQHHREELRISKDVQDRSPEAYTHGNLAIAYQSLGAHDRALEHYHLHLNLAAELRDRPSECRALSNLGNFHSSRVEFAKAVPYYQKYLNLCREVQDAGGQSKAYHCLGYAQFSLGNYREALKHYEQDLLLAKKQQDKASMGRAYCNLGLTYKALGSLDQAAECQKCFLSVAHSLGNGPGQFRAFGNLGDISMARADPATAAKFYQQQLVLAKQLGQKPLEAGAQGSIGAAYRAQGQHDRALSHLTQELALSQQLEDKRGECRAHGHLGAVYTALAEFANAFKCYQRQLQLGLELKDPVLEYQAHGNLGITRINMAMYEDALGFFEQQLATMERVPPGAGGALDRGRAYGSMGECYENLGDFEEAVRNYEQYLAVAQQAESGRDQDKAYRGLGACHQAVGNLQQALVCFEKRLVVAHALDSPAAQASAYGELGCLHSLLGNFEQALSCLEKQLAMSKEAADRGGEADAACGLGGVYQHMGEYQRAIQYHQIDLKIAEETGNASCQGRAYGNLGVTHESIGNYEQAIVYQEQHLSIAAQMNDRVAKTLAYSSLGRVHHALGHYPQAVTYLQQGLQIADQLGRHEDEAKIRHRLGLALWAKGSLDQAQLQLYKAAQLFEQIRQESTANHEYKLSLFDLQTASYQALQRVLVALGRKGEALAVAERGHTRAFVDLLMERQDSADAHSPPLTDLVLGTPEQVVEVVKKQSAAVLYYSIAVGRLYSWLLTPSQGLVKFHECRLSDLELDQGAVHETSSSESTTSINTLFNSSTSSQLDQYIGHAREALGVDSTFGGGLGGVASETESEAEDVFQHHLETVGGRLTESDQSFRKFSGGPRSGSSSDLSPLSLGANGSVFGKPPASSKNKRGWAGRPPLRTLYDLLLAPMEDSLPRSTGTDLVLVLQGELYSVPFGVLKGDGSRGCLFERFNLRVVPSLRALEAANSQLPPARPAAPGPTFPALVVGNPKLPPSVTDRWNWNQSLLAEQEAGEVGEVLGVKPLTGYAASRNAILRSVGSAECLHFATQISWKLSAIVVSPGHTNKAATANHGSDGPAERIDLNDTGHDSDLDSNTDALPLSEFLITAVDILNLNLAATKLVTLSAHSYDPRVGRITSDGIIGMARAFLSAGAQSVLVPLWPVPEEASKAFMKIFYASLVRGSRTSQALGEAMKAMQSTKQFAHPSNWAGFMLIGGDVLLGNKNTMFGSALSNLLCSPHRCREAMRVLLHLVEKSLQRIHQGMKNPMYTTQQSVVSKVAHTRGWKELLLSVGFRFEGSSNGVQAAVFFPTSDPSQRLQIASASLQAMLGLSPNSLLALAKLLPATEAAYSLIKFFRGVIPRHSKDREAGVQVPLNVKLWSTPGCHELLASLGFDLVSVGKDEVLLHTGKKCSRRMLHYVLQGLLAIFDTAEAPRQLPLESSSSLESLCSSHSGASVSNMSMSGMSVISTHSLNSSASSKISPASQRKAREGGQRPKMGQRSGTKPAVAQLRLTSTPYGNRTSSSSSLSPGLSSPYRSPLSLYQSSPGSPGSVSGGGGLRVAPVTNHSQRNNSSRSSSQEDLIDKTAAGRSPKQGNLNPAFSFGGEEVSRHHSRPKHSPRKEGGKKEGGKARKRSSSGRSDSASSAGSITESIAMKVLTDMLPHMESVEQMQREQAGQRRAAPPPGPHLGNSVGKPPKQPAAAVVAETALNDYYQERVSSQPHGGDDRVQSAEAHDKSPPPAVPPRNDSLGHSGSPAVAPKPPREVYQPYLNKMAAVKQNRPPDLVGDGHQAQLKVVSRYGQSPVDVAAGTGGEGNHGPPDANHAPNHAPNLVNSVNNGRPPPISGRNRPGSGTSTTSFSSLYSSASSVTSVVHVPLASRPGPPPSYANATRPANHSHSSSLSSTTSDLTSGDLSPQSSLVHKRSGYQRQNSVSSSDNQETVDGKNHVTVNHHGNQKQQLAPIPTPRPVYKAAAGQNGPISIKYENHGPISIQYDDNGKRTVVVDHSLQSSSC